ncbi:MAG: DEAD/DEAH box helicase family protein [Candidatus Peregrinibacteria bacterium]|nr:DEAD/DEAH box helicase family protein [Candidatus Peregrinibacteria bacterium]
MELKKYQQSALDTIRAYLLELQGYGPAHAFIYIKKQSYNSDYFQNIPFVCVKIPTGGGKTLVACYSVSEIMGSFLKNKMDKGIVMWFVPSEAIKTQTLRKFKNRNDLHRRVLDESFQNGVRIFSNEEALRIRKEDVQDNLCIIISSLEAFRKEKTLQKKYKVYQENGSLLSHFENLDDRDDLEKDEEGTIINSLANVVRMSHPLVVIDEGHKTQTELSFDFLNNLNPSFVIEYTATPRSASNILVNISPAELKDEQMVKIPLVLESSAQWQNAVARGLEKRAELEKEGKKNTGEYIRPIALIQAQPKSKTQNNVTVEQIKEYLLSTKISEEEIAIKTSDRNDLDGVDLFSKKCKIRYIITVNALAEGWDCSFAYVLISVANVGSKIAVEQIIGRIIRMPYAKRKKNEALNRSYIFASAKNFNEAASNIISGLERNGYSKLDLIAVSSNGDMSQDPKEVNRAVNKDFAVPLMSLEDEKLTFEELIGEDFELAKQNAEFDFEIHYDNDGRAIIDIEGDNKWHKGKQQILNLTYRDKNFSKQELVQWLDKKLRFTLLDKPNKVKFVDKAVDYQLNHKSLAELSVNRYLFLNRLNEAITNVLESYAKKRFVDFIDKKKIATKAFYNFPETITLKEQIPQKFNKNYYEKIDKLNKEELAFVERLDLDSLPNVEFWVRNREKQDPFFIQGWKKSKFYPDFVALTKNENIVALEWKGEDRISNEDTGYKVEIAEEWVKLGKAKLHFFLVHNGNVEEVLRDLTAL